MAELDNIAESLAQIIMEKRSAQFTGENAAPTNTLTKITRTGTDSQAMVNAARGLWQKTEADRVEKDTSSAGHPMRDALIRTVNPGGVITGGGTTDGNFWRDLLVTGAGTGPAYLAGGLTLDQLRDVKKKLEPSYGWGDAWKRRIPSTLDGKVTKEVEDAVRLFGTGAQNDYFKGVLRPPEPAEELSKLTPNPTAKWVAVSDAPAMPTSATPGKFPRLLGWAGRGISRVHDGVGNALQEIGYNLAAKKNPPGPTTIMSDVVKLPSDIVDPAKALKAMHVTPINPAVDTSGYRAIKTRVADAAGNLPRATEIAAHDLYIDPKRKLHPSVAMAVNREIGPLARGTSEITSTDARVQGARNIKPTMVAAPLAAGLMRSVGKTLPWAGAALAGGEAAHLIAGPSDSRTAQQTADTLNAAYK